MFDTLAEVNSGKLGDTPAEGQEKAPVQKLSATLKVVFAETVNDRLSEVAA